MKGDHIKYTLGYKYQLEEDYTVQVGILPLHPVITHWIVLMPTGWMTFWKGYAWDGPSGPTIDTPDSMRGSLVHDGIYQLLRLGLLDICFRGKADDLLCQICIEDGMVPLRAYTWKEAVGMFAAGCAKTGTEQEVLIAPRPYVNFEPKPLEA